jgi:hypothetical protein
MDLELCSSIIKLNLSYNNISRDENLYYLSNIPNLKQLNLSENPIAKSDNYKSMIQDYLPILDILDKDFEDIEEKLMNSTLTSSVNMSIRPDSSKKMNITDGFDESLKTSLNSDTIQGIKSILRQKKDELSPIRKKGKEVEENPFYSSRSSFNKQLKPVIIKKSCDIDNVLEIARQEEERRLADEILSKIEKTNKTKHKIMQSEGIIKKGSLRCSTNEPIKVINIYFR